MSTMKNLIAALSLFLTAAVHCGEPASPHVVTVERFVAAFNAHDSAAMAEFVADDIEWLSISGKQMTVEASGKADLIESMNAYFTSCPSCQSKLTKVAATDGRVSAIEIASWTVEHGRNLQSAMSVYEFSDGLIQRVYYFPAEN
ncbi:MAG: nuclear transport factor 2 family protein [Gammaproteobacteria bacterium]